MMTFKKISLFCLLVSLLLACTTEETNSPEWIWVQTSGSIAGITITPETEGYTAGITIEEDKITFFKDGVETNTYESMVFKTDTIDQDSVMRKFIKYNDNIRRYEENGEELILRDLCCDGYKDHYKK